MPYFAVIKVIIKITAGESPVVIAPSVLNQPAYSASHIGSRFGKKHYLERRVKAFFVIYEMHPFVQYIYIFRQNIATCSTKQ